MSWTLYLGALMPLAAGVACLLGWRVARIASLIGGVSALALSVLIALHVRHGAVITAAHGWLRVDALSGVFMLAVGIVYCAATVFSIGYIGIESGTSGFASFSRTYMAGLNLFGWALVLLPMAADLGTLWVAVELTTVISALLVAIDRTDAALEAAWKYVLIASSGLGIALLAVVILYAAGTHTLGSAYLPRFERLIAHGGDLSRDAVQIAFVLAVVGFGTKVGFVPMHTWLPDAHSEVPAPVSALLSGSLLAGAFYAILRFFQIAVAAGQRNFAQHVLIVFGVISLVAAALFVLRQRNYKRLLAYSSIEHMAIVAIGVGFGAPLAVAGALLHVITHAGAKGLAFFGAGSLLRGYDTKEISGVSDAGRRMPWTGPLFMGAILALSGLPISGVFRSEFEIVTGGLSGSQNVGVVVLLVFVNVAFFGVAWHAGRMVLSKPDAPDAVGSGAAAGAAGDGVIAGGAGEVLVRERSVWMIAAMLLCAIVVFALGLHLPGELSSLLSSAQRQLAVPR